MLRKSSLAVIGLSFVASIAVVVPLAPTAHAAQPKPQHTKLVPDAPKANMPRITTGEITDIAYFGNRVFIAGGFTSIRNNTATNTTNYNQQFLASYNIDTGLVDANFKPVFGGGGVTEIELSPDGTKLYVAGKFSTVNGVTKRKFASINPTTGATVAGFTANADGAGTSLEATNSTVYLGGQFTTINGVAKSSLAAVNGTTGALVPNFNNDLTGGIGVNGALTVQALMLSHDESTLVVVHTGRQIAGQDRYGIGMISTTTNQLLPWRTRLWDDNLQFIGGITRIYAGDIAPNDQYFVVSSASGGDRPPISDTAVAYSMTGNDNVQPLWITRMFDSVYSVAISETAVYIGGHFNYMPAPGSDNPWPGLTDVGYGQGQGLAGYGLGDQIVTRDHIGALNPVDGKALEWSPGSDSFEGNKAMIVTPRGLFAGGDANVQGSMNTGRIAFYDFNTVAAAGANETTIINPIMGRVKTADVPFVIDGTATATSGVSRVQIEVRDRDTNRYLQDDLVTWGAANTINSALASPNATSTTWTLGLTIAGNHKFQVLAKTFGVNGSSDATKATKNFETFGLADQTPSTSISGPSGSIIPTTTFTVTGTATDDVGVDSIIFSFRDANQRYLQDDGTVDVTYNTFRGQPDVVGAVSATWSYEVTVPYEGNWTMQAIAVDTAGQSDLRSADATWLVSATAIAPTVAITSPAIMTPPTAAATVTVVPGQALTFSGSATDDQNLYSVEIAMRNNTTRENLAADGSFATSNQAGYYKVSPDNLNAASYNWTFTLPADKVKPGNYSFQVRAVDDLQIPTTSANTGKLTINAQVPGDNFPDGKLNVTGTVNGLQSLHLDLAGTSTDDIGVKSVHVSIIENVSGRYLQADGTLSAAYAELDTQLANPLTTSTTFAGSFNLPIQGDYSVTAYAYDTSDQQDPSTSGATARYPIYPGDLPPTVTEGLLAPTEGTVFTGSKILASGRFEDDQQMAQGQVAIRNSANLYMQSNGTFSGTGISWRTAFLNSPGSAGSNFSYTSPAIPPGSYTVLARGIDQHGFATAVPTERHVTVTAPPTNVAPVGAFSYTCGPTAALPATAVNTWSNACKFDGRTSTDENAPTLTYAWTYVLGTSTSTGTGSFPSKTFTTPGAYTVTLTVKDEYGLTSVPVSQVVTIAAPRSNLPPVPVINPESCAMLVCNISAIGTLDPNVGDSFTYAWNYGDPATTGTSSSASHSFPAAGTYLVTLTATDGWGASASTTRSITVSGTVVVTNAAPTAVIPAPACSLLTCTFASTGSADSDGSIVDWTWNFGDGTTYVGATPPAHTFPATGSWGVTLTVTDNAGATGFVSRTVTVSSTVNTPPVAAFSQTCSVLTCTFDGSASADADGTLKSYAWTFGDGSVASGLALTNPSHTYAGVGPWTVGLTVTDNQNATNATNHAVTAPGGTNALPTAAFTFNCTPGLGCSFDASGSSDSDGNVVNYAWTFGDTASGTGVTTSHTYSNINVRTVTLTVTDNVGGVKSLSQPVTPVAGATNAAPTAAFTSSCTQLVCTVDASGSVDADGSINGYSWVWGDGTANGSGVGPSHTYAAGGTFAITLTVTDNLGLAGTPVSHNVNPAVAATTVAFKASATATGSGAAASVTVPAGVAAGDQLLLFVSANTSTTASTPAGWTLLGTAQDGTPDMAAWVFRRTASAADAGSTVSSTLGDAAAKSTRIVVAYSGGSVPTVIASSVIGTTATNSLAAPSVSPGAGARVVRFWVNKSADATGWTLPGGVTSRGQAVGTGSGRVVAAVGDGTAGGSATATALGTASAKGIAFSVVVAP